MMALRKQVEREEGSIENKISHFIAKGTRVKPILQANK